jgi:mersacidin/lichenicidin family type 2 lantibiotic
MTIDIKRAWTDPAYRDTLSQDELAQLPPSPAGDAELTEGELDKVSGGMMMPGDAPPTKGPGKTAGGSECWYKERSKRLGQC